MNVIAPEAHPLFFKWNRDHTMRQGAEIDVRILNALRVVWFRLIEIDAC
jgi:hypothetical protein